MLTIKIKPDKGMVDQAGNYPVFLYAYFNGQRFKHSTGEKCSQKQWDKERELASNIVYH
ncbi:Arm DNA-binding domain-containing protein [Spirosoma linguale]|uniref:Arm DNA-binding domain-containing protein n=1 Tax=Spirosoma linguale (strain ATCC 33905 / DSM 74 / LMG 10896 / Claus 1) TaxID=504472 RepID=D2QKV4_SPILD|nr:hypothetical protein Slin_4286 [Spirosoma linguale DSM 74]